MTGVHYTRQASSTLIVSLLLFLSQPSFASFNLFGFGSSLKDQIKELTKSNQDQAQKLIDKESEIRRLTLSLAAFQEELKDMALHQQSLITAASGKAKKIIEDARKEAATISNESGLEHQRQLEDYEAECSEKKELIAKQISELSRQRDRLQVSLDSLINDTFDPESSELEQALSKGVWFKVDNKRHFLDAFALQKIKWTPFFMMLIPNRMFDVSRDEQGDVVLSEDDPEVFRYVYRYVKNPSGKVFGLSSCSIDDLECILDKSRYYGLDDFSQSLEHHIEQRQKSARIHVKSIAINKDLPTDAPELIKNFVREIQKESGPIEIVEVTPVQSGYGYNGYKSGYGYGYTKYIQIFYRFKSTADL